MLDWLLILGIQGQTRQASLSWKNGQIRYKWSVINSVTNQLLSCPKGEWKGGSNGVKAPGREKTWQERPSHACSLGWQGEWESPAGSSQGQMTWWPCRNERHGLKNSFDFIRHSMQVGRAALARKILVWNDSLPKAETRRKLKNEERHRSLGFHN